MAATQPRTVRKRLLRILIIVLGIFIIASVALHIWFINNAKGALKQIISKESHGKLKLELSELSFSLFSNKMQIREADLSSVDSLNQPTTYRIKFRKLTVKVSSIWPLLLQKKLLLDSIKLHDPEIEVVQWRPDTSAVATNDDLSITQEMGKLYNSMLDGLDAFNIKRIKINNASLSLINKMKPGIPPVTVSKIYFNLVRTAKSPSRRDMFIENEQTVELNTTDQQIHFPNGIHNLAFKRFHLELFGKRIQLDSCTLTAKTNDTTRSSYTVFFDKLMLVGVDFDAMYRKNLIRADSVYCENPLFNINLNQSGAKSKSKSKERPDPSKIVKELTGDLDLAYIGVKDAGIHINITGSKQRSLFNSNKDDFEMRGLRINSDSTTPVSVDRFDMLVRDYRLYNEDSSAMYTLDSIHFLNNKIVLNNFFVSTVSTRVKARDTRTIRVPYFELTGLDWNQLIFESNLQAKAALLKEPVIDYTRIKQPRVHKKTSFFESLQTLDNLMTLDKLNIVNGQINFKLPAATSFSLQDVNLGIYSNMLLKSNDKKDLRKAIQLFSFTNGVFKSKDITANLKNVQFTGKNLIYAEQLLLNSRNNNIKATVDDVYLDNVVFDDNEESIEVEGLRWKKAAFTLKSGKEAKAGKKSGKINLKGIAGNNTSFVFVNDKTRVSTFINSVKLNSLERNGNQPFKIEGLSLSGNRLDLNSGPLQLKAASYSVQDNGSSFLSQVVMSQVKERDSLHITAQRIGFSADINSLLAGNMNVASVDISKPLVKIQKWSVATNQRENPSKTSLNIGSISLDEPVISIALHKNDSVTSIELPYSANSSIRLNSLQLSPGNLQLGNLSAKTNSARFIKPDGTTLGVANGKVDLDISDISLSQKNGQLSWGGLINKLYMQHPDSFSIGKNRNKLFLEQMAFGNLRLSSEYITDFKKLLKFNLSVWLQTTTGQYSDSNTTLKWYNAAYNNGNRTLSLDSFNYYPTKSKDSVMAQAAFQTDYITFKSGHIELTDFNLEKYEKDSVLLANTLNITNPLITVFRDKKPPFLAGRIKPLPVDLIRKIGIPVSVQRMNLIDGSLSYSEKHPKTRAEGTLYLTHMNARISNIRNHDISGNDSLSLALDTYLMDSALLNLRVKESYTDTLGSFLMTLRMKPTSLSFLNPVLAPLSNIQITSGKIDSFYLRVIGRDDLALGEMKMFYHDLKIKLVKDGDPEKSSLLTRVASFLANALIIKKNNEGRTGIAYFKRLKDRSFFNYIVKTTFSGMATSIGAKKNRKYLKAYRRELKERELPPIDLE